MNCFFFMLWPMDVEVVVEQCLAIPEETSTRLSILQHLGALPVPPHPNPSGIPSITQL